jgi:hypothetical protein
MDTKSKTYDIRNRGGGRTFVFWYAIGRSRCGLVVIATGYWLDDRGLISCKEEGIFVISTTSRPALELTQSLFQWGLFSRW